MEGAWALIERIAHALSWVLEQLMVVEQIITITINIRTRITNELLLEFGEH